MRNLVYPSYTATTSGNASMLSGIHKAIPYVGLHNSATGDGPKDTRGYISAAVTNAVVSVANFVYNGLVAVGNMIEHAAEVVAEFAMK